MKLRSRIVFLVFVLVAGFWVFGQFYVIHSISQRDEDSIEKALNGAVSVFIKNQPTRERTSFKLLEGIYLNKDIVKGLTETEDGLWKVLQSSLGGEGGQAADRPAEPGMVRHNYTFLHLQMIKDGNKRQHSKRKSDIRHINSLIVTDAKGIEIARTEDAKWKKKDWSAHYSVKKCLAGIPQEDVWVDKDLGLPGPQMVNCHPIRHAGAIYGVAIMARSISGEFITWARDSAISDRNVEVALWGKSGIVASTLTPQRHKALGDYYRSNTVEYRTLLDKVIKTGSIDKEDLAIRTAVLDDETFMLINTSFFLPEGKQQVGMSFMYSWSNQNSYLSTMSMYLFGFGLLLLLLGVALAMMIVQYAYDAIDYVLDGANKVILGNKEFQFASEDQYLDSLGQTLNVMNGILSGRLIPEDEDEQLRMDIGSGGPLKGGMLLIENIDATKKQEPASGQQEAEVKDLYEQDKEKYFNDLFRRFVQAKVECGEDVSTISRDRFVQKLENTSKRLVEKHGCKAVRFEIHVKNNKVTLSPVPKWD